MTDTPSPNRTPEDDYDPDRLLRELSVLIGEILGDKQKYQLQNLAKMQQLIAADRKTQHDKGYEAGYDNRTLEADHELEDALKAQATALLEKLPPNIDPYQFESSLGGPKVFPAKYTGFNEALDQVRSIIKEHLP